MSTLLTAQNIGKRYAAEPLFEGISVHISEGTRLGVIGPNGAGKSSLLKILAGEIEADSGNIARRRGLRIAYVAQTREFPEEISAMDVVLTEASSISSEQRDWKARLALSSVGFRDPDVIVGSLSGGWKKRLGLAAGIVQEPDLLFLDEPTNHLDLESILWLEQFLRQASFAWIAISHDRLFLDRVALSILEINRIYPNGAHLVSGNYTAFLEKKEQFLASQESHRASLENKLRRETEWLRRGPKARTTKARYRIDAAKELMINVNNLSSRLRTQSSEFEFSEGGRQTKRLIEVEHLAKSFPSIKIANDLNLVLSPGDIIGILGANGTGKSSILKMLAKEEAPDSGQVKHVSQLRLAYFDQQRQALDPKQTLKHALADSNDTVLVNGQAIHVIAWAKRFMLKPDQLSMPVGKLSGGEQARVLLANLMRQAADVLILDEPTNDLDIPALETLEESLMEFSGAVVLVSHDRYLLDRLCDSFVGLNGTGSTERFATYEQWERSLKESTKSSSKQEKDFSNSASKNDKKLAPNKLSYKEQREYNKIEELILSSEKELELLQQEILLPEIASNGTKLIALSKAIAEKNTEVEKLYSRWQILDDKIKSQAE